PGSRAAQYTGVSALITDSGHGNRDERDVIMTKSVKCRTGGPGEPVTLARGEGSGAGEVLAEPADVRARVGGLGDQGRPSGAGHSEEDGWLDLARLNGGVAVTARAELVPRVVAVHQVDPPGDRLHPVDHAGELVAARVGMAGVQAEADLPGALAVPGR